MSAILTLGIAMSVAMFSLLDAVLLRPLPFPDQESIHVIRKFDPLAGNHVEELAYPELHDLQENIRGFEYVAVMPTSLYGYARVLQHGTADPVLLEGNPVSHDFFRVLGVSPALGRDFTSADEQVGAPPVVILAERTWREHLGADPDIIGRTIRLSNQGYSVIGVMAPGVEFPRGATHWVPLGVRESVVQRRGATFLHAVARAQPSYSRNQIADDVNALFGRLAAEHPGTYSPSQQAIVTPLAEFWIGSARAHLWIMLAASLLLLGSAAISAGSIMLSRTISRRPEIATHMALGAQRGQILVQLVAEGLMIACFAALAGLGIANVAIRFLVRWDPGDIPRLAQATLDPRSFAFAASVAGFVAILCSLSSGWTAFRMRLDTAIRSDSGRSSMTRRTGTARNVFILSQAALTAVLVSTTVLLVLSYVALTSADTGFANRDTLSMDVQLRGPGLFPAQSIDRQAGHAYYGSLVERLRQQPGVSSAAAILLRPLEGTIGWDVPYEFEFETSMSNRAVLPKANYEVVTSDYFETVGTPLLEGRDFGPRDSEGAEPVAIINQTLAEQIRVHGHAPLGLRIRLGSGSRVWRRVIGICGNATYRALAEARADVFVPFRQVSQPTRYVLVRGNRSAKELSEVVRRVVKETDPSQGVGEAWTIGDLIDRNLARHRFNVILLLWFGGIAVMLAISGVYGVVSETMAAREHEVAIKKAIGAPRDRIVREAVARPMRFALLGYVIGAALVASAENWAEEVLHGVSARDPVVLGSVGACLFALSIATAYWRARDAIDTRAAILLRTG